MKRARVLLADDDEGVRAALLYLLRPSEFEVVGEAANGHTVVAEATRLQPEVVLLNPEMPGLGGLEALPRLRDCLPSAAIVVLTGHQSQVYREEARRLGANAFVLKRRAPFDLIPAIERSLRVRKMPPLRQE